MRIMNSYRQRGFLFVDVLLAAFILTAVLLAIGSGFTLSTRATHQAAEYTVAANLAQKQLEVLRGMRTVNNWDGLALPGTIQWETRNLAGTDERLVYTLVNMNRTINGANMNFTDQITCNNVPYLIRTQAIAAPEDIARLVQVTVTVAWQDTRNQTQFIQATNFYRRLAVL